ncbi:hypothetical protein PNP85_00430 [Halobacterium salinarum]|uniref:hypothetical protein n=1 Tax=Halobacterium salinarum TaxID=2242 RepID=UPI00255507FA|nr:hypothetical protein [Halobacterium salinarum]MDL0126461.1 hypothetical protein [Halobacterium salinarum]MDL0137982.1 hypothetical protein [Halobacterium salinarum]
MSTQTGHPRYVIYLSEACDHLAGLDASLEKRIRKRIEKFLRVWNATDVFEKSVTDDVDYIKKRRGETRAFVTYLEVDGLHLLIVLTVFKQDEKDKFWLEKALYQSKAEDYRAELQEIGQGSSLKPHIENLRENDDYLVVESEK